MDVTNDMIIALGIVAIGFYILGVVVERYLQHPMNVKRGIDLCCPHKDNCEIIKSEHKCNCEHLTQNK